VARKPNRTVLPGKRHSVLRAWFRRRLLAWFAIHQRPLPWRRNRDPYAIWVSEIMLQQTQAATVVPYFRRFLKCFPTLGDLAHASEHEVLQLWEGLGYYRRARDLHRAARQLRDDYDGQFPRHPVTLQALPGFGRYTVGAVLSQAFDCRLPVVETNSMRVLCRWFGLKGNPRTGPMQKKIWRLAEGLLPSKRVGEFNQALMELGALVCTPQGPRCGACPLAGHCQARRFGLQDRIPPRSQPVAIQEVVEVAMVLYRGKKVLLVQRLPTGRWANMWEFPHAPVNAGEEPAAAGKRLLAKSAGIQAGPQAEILTLRHGITRYRITMVCLLARYRSGQFASSVYQQGKWVTLGELAEYPVSAPQRRLARFLMEERAI
jgi:A/G-specific adenine glycosylase